jgi:hypothetical protein
MATATVDALVVFGVKSPEGSYGGFVLACPLKRIGHLPTVGMSHRQSSSQWPKPNGQE